MSAAVHAQQPRIEEAKAGVIFHAYECESALRTATFAELESMSEGLQSGLRKLASYHSEQAFRWAEAFRYVNQEGRHGPNHA